jgi:hypothetical protein
MSFQDSLEQSLAAGVDASEAAAKANCEIEETIKAFISFLESKIQTDTSVSHKRGILSVNLDRKKRKEWPNLLSETIALSQPRWVEITEAIEVGSERLCELERSTRGFPVEVRYLDLSTSAHNKDGLERIFTNMLKEPGVTSKFVRLVVTPKPAS